jgi:hypothetical protein
MNYRMNKLILPALLLSSWGCDQQSPPATQPTTRQAQKEQGRQEVQQKLPGPWADLYGILAETGSDQECVTRYDLLLLALDRDGAHYKKTPLTDEQYQWFVDLFFNSAGNNRRTLAGIILIPYKQQRQGESE